MKRWRAGCGLLAGGLFLFQAGGGATTGALVDRLNASSRAPLPTVPQRDPVRPDMVWVPDRYVPLPDSPAPAHVPGHWERRISDREFYAPPTVIISPTDGSLRLVPAGVRPPVDSRVGP